MTNKRITQPHHVTFASIRQLDGASHEGREIKQRLAGLKYE